MTTSDWHYLENQFDNATKSSRKRMVILSNEHLASLDAEKGDALIGTLHQRFIPVHQSFIKIYTDWKKAKGIHKGTTKVVDENERLLGSKKIGEWDNKISAIVGENSSDHITLLPTGRSPFQKGGRDTRVTEVEGLAKRLADYASLNAVKTDVDAFHTLLQKVRHNQQTKEQDIQQLADVLEEKRLELAVMMYANLGSLMNMFAGSPEKIKRYFNLEVLRQTGSEEEEVEPILQPDTPQTAAV